MFEGKIKGLSLDFLENNSAESLSRINVSRKIHIENSLEWMRIGN